MIKVICLALVQIIHIVLTYLPTEEYRDLSVLTGDYSSPQFFNYFKVEYNSLIMNSNTFVSICQSGTIFGYFSTHFVSNYFNFQNYASISINFNLLIRTSKFSASDSDQLLFSINHDVREIVSLKNLTSQSVGNTSSGIIRTPISTMYCGENVQMFNISIIYKNTNSDVYKPLRFDMKSSFQHTSSIDWAISNINVMQVNCPPKCSMCTTLACVGCTDPNTVYKPNTCACVSGLYDYNDITAPLNCKSNIILM